ncbi:MAG: MmgE/PrpD family protein, partial [Firmicutes bacterium]|nr:MmgE/PrpD family protein [Bacillota bacterium]
GEAEWARGYPTNPLDPEALLAKFLDCARGTMEEEEARKAFEAVRDLPSAARAADRLAPLWRAPAAAR